MIPVATFLQEPLQSFWLKKWGIGRISDFVDPFGRLLSTKEAMEKGLPWKAALEWQGAVNALRPIVDSILIRREGPALYYGGPVERDGEVEVTWYESKWNLLELTPKVIKQQIAKGREVLKSKFESMMEDEFGLDEGDWANAHQMGKKVARDMKLRDFGFRLRKGLIFGNTQYLLFLLVYYEEILNR